jgi:hypothetical protein
MTRLARTEIYKVINQYIGVEAGQLRDFTVGSHTEFYRGLGLELDPNDYPGTTLAQFVQVVSRSDAKVQAVILRGILKKFPVGSSVQRTDERYQDIRRLIERLENVVPVSTLSPRITTSVVERAIADAETLLRTSGATSGVDRIHTALHGYLVAVCADAGITHAVNPSLTELFKLLKQHPGLAVRTGHSSEIGRILRAFGNVLDSLNTLRNQASVAHPNAALLGQDKALLAINAARTVLHYLDSRLSA